MNRPLLPDTMRRALADLIGFGSLKPYPAPSGGRGVGAGRVYAARDNHLPELGHEQRDIEALIGSRYATGFPDGHIEATAAGHAEYSADKEARGC